METGQTRTISQSIKQACKKQLLLPTVYLLLLAILWLATPISGLAFPRQVSSEVPFRELGAGNFSYISTTLTGLHFTGYTQKVLGHTNGYYYYTFQGGRCILALLSPSTCGDGISDIGQLRIQARIIRNFADYGTLTSLLAHDLNWTASGIRSQVPDYLLSEPGSHKALSLLLLGSYFASGAYALVTIFLCLAYILFPILSPTCRRLKLYGDARKLLAQAEEELAAILQRPGVPTALPRSTAKDLYVTENFFLAFTDGQVFVVPIHEVIWIYKHSTLHRSLRRNLKASYTLHIMANKRVHVQCSKYMESEIDGVMDGLSKASRKILVGFSEENRAQAQKRLGASGFLGWLASMFQIFVGFK